MMSRKLDTYIKKNEIGPFFMKKAQATEAKSIKRGYTKLKGFCAAQETTEKIERDNLQNGRKYLQTRGLRRAYKYI